MTKQTGRPSIFGPKDGTQRIYASGLTKRGAQLFKAAKARLKKLAKWPGTVSDGDAIEYLVRGEDESAEYLRQK